MNERRLRRLLEVRRRLRDQTSAVSETAARQLLLAEEQQVAATAAQTQFATSAIEALQALQSTSDFWLLEHERRAHGERVASEAARVAKARTESEAARTQLRARAHDLRVSELLLEQNRLSVLQRELQGEQRLVDDLIASRREES